MLGCPGRCLTFCSLKVSITLSFVGSVIAETVASNKGVGNMMLIASSQFNATSLLGADSPRRDGISTLRNICASGRAHDGLERPERITSENAQQQGE